MKVKILDVEEDKIVNDEFRVLHLVDVSTEVYSKLLTPRLKVIGFEFIREYSEVTVWLQQPEFIDLFSSWAKELRSKLDSSAEEDEQVEIFNWEIRQLIILGRVDGGLGQEKIMGIFGELSALYQLLISAEDPQEILEGWNRPDPAIHDFDYAEYGMEIKAVGRSKTTIGISSKYQLNPRDKKLILKVYKLNVRPKSNEDSLGELYTRIFDFLGSGLGRVFEEKCAADSFASYLGPQRDELDFSISVLSEDNYEVIGDFPRIGEVHAAISNIRYDLDISALEKFKID